MYTIVARKSGVPIGQTLTFIVLKARYVSESAVFSSAYSSTAWDTLSLGLLVTPRTMSRGGMYRDYCLGKSLKQVIRILLRDERAVEGWV